MVVKRNGYFGEVGCGVDCEVGDDGCVGRVVVLRLVILVRLVVGLVVVVLRLVMMDVLVVGFVVRRLNWPE